MATFAEYPQPTAMASMNIVNSTDEEDFTLYPYQDPWTQEPTYVPLSTYAEVPYMNATAFETYNHAQNFAALSEEFHFGAQHHHFLEQSSKPAMPIQHHSPAVSTSHSFDYHQQHPPVLSSTSDSGASAISSAMGSPSTYPQHTDWSQSAAMAMLPGIVQPADGPFAMTTFDFDPIPAIDKGCVGESTNVSSVSQSCASISFVPSLGVSNDHSSPSPWSQPARLVSNNGDGLNGGYQHSGAADSNFVPPNLPASATSPNLRRAVKHQRRRTSTSTYQLLRRIRSPTPISPINPSPPRTPAQASNPALPSSPFSQSNGSFILPLESSCSSSLHQFMHFYVSVSHSEQLDVSAFLFHKMDLPDWLLTLHSTDPALIQPFSPQQHFTDSHFLDARPVAPSPPTVAYPHAPSPVPSRAPAASPRAVSGKNSNNGSPYMRQQSWQPYPQHNSSRRQSISSIHSRHSHVSQSSDDSNKGLCTIPSCGRHVKDLKAHMLTHQNERPEKCPIPTCEYHTKGFARKYDKNRHTLTHYKGTMVCGFCPGSGSAAEKSFNRADVFKRHLTSVHNVEQTPPNARRKTTSPAANSKRPFHAGLREAASGVCSTCGHSFASAQDFYEHLDDCVLRVVQQADPAEAINERLLASIADDSQVQETMGRHGLPTGLDFNAPTSFDEDEDAEDVEDHDHNADEDESKPARAKAPSSKRAKAAGNPQ